MNSENNIFSERGWINAAASTNPFEMARRGLDIMRGTDWLKQAGEYWIDATQKSILFADIMRKRGNNYIDHVKEGMPPALVFDYERIMDGRKLERPVNYALVRIIDRRKKKRNAPENGVEKRKRPLSKGSTSVMRPIVIIDPRAGHGHLI